MKKTIILAAAAALALATAACPGSGRPDYEALKTPRISTRPSQKMLVVTVKGAPEQVLAAAFGGLSSTYYRLPETIKSGPPPATRLRCAVPDGTTAPGALPTPEFTAEVGLPLPEAVKSIPAGPDSGLKIEVWEYGETAEILHRGPYDKETPTIRALLDFIKARGYKTAGVHEEEYVSGPETPGASPDAYLTVIRYPVKKAEGGEADEHR